MDTFTILLLIFVVGAHAHSCVPCDKSKCKIETCIGSKVFDVCRCCRVCAKQLNETCGGLYETHGKCETGFTCVIQPENGDYLTDQEKGICKHTDSLTSSDTCKEVEFDGCDAINEKCVCERRRACTNPFQFLSRPKCETHLLRIEEAKRNCVNHKCEVRYSPKCSEDSELVNAPWPAGECCPLPSTCECSIDRCRQKLCSRGYERVLVQRATGKPGRCCDQYKCKAKADECATARCRDSNTRNLTCPSDSVKITGRMTKDGCCELPAKCQCKSKVCHMTKCRDGYQPMVIVRSNARPGTCCDIIECVNASSLGVCRSNGKDYKHGENFAVDACRSCECVDGFSRCYTKQCPVLPCGNQWTPPGVCCPKCKITIKEKPTTVRPVRYCNHNGVLHPPGESWYTSSCEKCVCENDGPNCISEGCAKLCENPRSVEGSCCGVCDEPTYMTIPISCPSMRDCKLGGKECPFGFKSDKMGCRLCECRDRFEVCPSLSSCKLNCTKITDEIGCERCSCAGRKKECKDLKTCKKECPFGYRKDRNGCKKCRCRRCDDVLAICDKKCPHGRQMNDYGCEICKCVSKSDIVRASPDKMRSRSCKYNGIKRDDGEGWMTPSGRKCVCRWGNVLCDMLICSVPHCDHPVMMKGYTCPVCPDSLPDNGKSLQCRGSYVQGESWKPDECTSCICISDSIMCTTEECKPAPCAKPVFDEGHCCPVCKDKKASVMSQNSSICTDQSGTSYIHGSSWRTDTCTSCKCDNGAIKCFGEKCPQVHNCENPVIKLGQCCPQCLDDISMNSCIVGDRTYSHGEVWAMSSDSCSFCTCVHGNTICRREICRKIPRDCKKIFRIPGACCDVCIEISGRVRNPPTEIPTSPSSDSTPIIIGASVVGGVLLIAGIIISIVVLKCSRKKRTPKMYHKGTLQKSGDSTAADK